MSYELDAFKLLGAQLPESEKFSPAKAKEGYYTALLKQYRLDNPEPDPDYRAVPDFEQLWEQLEHHAAKLAKTNWSLMKATSSLGAKASELGITRLTTRDLQQLLDDAARQSRATAQPIGEGGIFRVKSTPWVVDGIFRHGLNLLTGQAGAAKSRLCGALAGAWISGNDTFMGRELRGPNELDDRHVLIIGTDQNREDWQLTLKQSSLLRTYGTDTATGEQVVQLHPGLTLHTLEEGIRLDADGIALIRRWCDAHPNCGVIIDSFSACLPPGVDEDKASAARPVHDLNAALGSCWAVLLHHNRKGAGKDRNIGVGAGRGSGAIDAAVSRVIGLGLIHKMEGGALVAQESDPRRELISTKRGGATLHLVINSNDWAVEGTADELKRQEREQHMLSNLTEAQTDVLSVLEATDDWITTRDVVTGLGDDYGDGKGGKAATVRKTLKRLETMGLIESKRVGHDRCYHQVSQSEPPKVYMTSSLSSPTAAQGVSLAHPLAHKSSLPVSEPPEGADRLSEPSEQGELPSEPLSEPPKTQSLQRVSQVSQGKAEAPESVSSNEVMTPKPFQSQGGIDVITDSPPLQPQEKKRRRTQLAFAIPELSPEKQPDEDDPAWGARPTADAA